MMTAPEKRDVEAMAAHMVRCIEQKNLDALERFNAPGMTIWHNIDNTEMPWDQAKAFLQIFIDNVESLHYEKIRVIEIPNGWIQQHVLRMILKNGHENIMPAALFVKLNASNEVTHIEEYIDIKQLGMAMPFLLEN